eukprot:107135-Chlamydomonas_euryale.AAC.2
MPRAGARQQVLHAALLAAAAAQRADVRRGDRRTAAAVEAANVRAAAAEQRHRQRGTAAVWGAACRTARQLAVGRVCARSRVRRSDRLEVRLAVHRHGARRRVVAAAAAAGGGCRQEV